MQCSGVTASLNTWYHIAVTRDASGTRRFFVDGILRSTQTGSPAPTDSSGVLTFGRAGDYAGEYFAGRIDEVRLSNIARYTANFTPPTTPLPSDANTVALWHLNEGSGQTIADASGNGRNGTLGTSSGSDSADPAWSSNTPVSGTAGKQERASGGGHVRARLAQMPALQGGGAGGTVITTTITYRYDPLYRLTSATYSSGAYYDYTYDSVGNRLSERRESGIVITYTYDIANRLIASTGVTHTWDANGNMLSDGTSNYAYDSANRLVSVSGQGSAFSFGYNGLGDRISQTVNSLTTNYVLDLNAGLTQVLAAATSGQPPATNYYLYGNGRIAQVSAAAGTDYFLSDALGSVRQLVDASGSVTLAKGYEPYGSVRSSVGSGASVYGFTGEQQSGGLVYLRARYYASGVGRFLTRDTWNGDMNRPMSYNAWLYVYADPINLADPSGHDPWWCDWQPNPTRCRQNYWNALRSMQSGRWGGTPSPTSTPTLTPSPTCTLTPTRTPFPTRTPTATVLPDFDPQTGPLLPRTDWSYLTDPARQARSETVLGWLTYYEGPDASGRRPPWWKNANGSLDTVRIAAFILQYELAELEHVRLELQEGAAQAVRPINLGAKIIRYDLETNGLNKTSLSRYTAFFDPRWGGGFTEVDWGLWLKGPISTYVGTVKANSGSPGSIRNWWREWEIRCNNDDRQFEYRYWLHWATEPEKPSGSGPNDEFFFGTREQFNHHCVGGH